MTTNITSILNENLDMFDMTETLSLKEEADMVAEQLRKEAEEAQWYEDTTEWLKEAMDKLIDLEEGSDEFESLWAIYRDVYKDMNGIRPQRDSVAYMRKWRSYAERYFPDELR